MLDDATLQTELAVSLGGFGVDPAHPSLEEWEELADAIDDQGLSPVRIATPTAGEVLFVEQLKRLSR